MMTQSTPTFILPILHRGHSGGNVQYLQELLNTYGYSLKIDGNFDPRTEATVKEFQKSRGLTPDGIIDSKTWNALHAEWLSTYTGSLLPKSNLTAIAIAF